MRQIVEQRGECFDFGGTSSTSPIFQVGDSWNLSLRLNAFQNSQFAGGGQGDGVDFFARDLRERIELAQRFQFVAEKFQPHRPRAGGRPDIEDAAAQGDFAFLRDLRLGFVALFLQPFDQVERIDLVAALERAGAFLNLAGGKSLLTPVTTSGDPASGDWILEESATSVYRRSLMTSACGSLPSCGKISHAG